MYPVELGVKVVRASSLVYLTETLVQAYISDLQHCFVSAESKAEAYNERFVNREKEKVRYFETFLLFHPEVGRRFQSKNVQDGTCDETVESETSQMHELGRKMLSAGYYNHQVYNEMVDRNSVSTEIFVPKTDPLDQRKTLTFKESLEQFMKKTDEQRRNELYKHTDEDCSTACKKRGCGQVATADGLWKLTYKICMYEPKHPYPNENIEEYLPNVCPEQPTSGGAFCEEHAKLIRAQNYPTELRPFLEKCGANPNAYTAAGRNLVKSVLEKLSNDVPQVGETAEDVQGVGYLLRNRDFATAENFEVKPKEVGDCRKDIGEAPRLHRRFCLTNLSKN